MKSTKKKRQLAIALSIATVSAAPGAADCLWSQDPGESPGLTVSEAVVRALEYHPSVGAAAAGVEVASAALGEARSHWWPQIRLEASVMRHQLPMLTTPIHQFSVEAIPPFDRTLIGGSAMAGFTVFDGGGRIARIGVASADARGAGAQAESARQALVASVTASYLTVLTARGVLDAHESLVTALAAELDRAGRRVSEGTAAQVELLRAEAALAAAQADQVAAAARLDVAERNLARVIGASVGETGSDRLTPVALTTAATADTGRRVLQDRSRLGNPELARARETVASAESSRRAAIARWWPRIELAGGWIGYGYPDGFQTEWQLAARLSYPLFTGGSRSYGVALAGARTDAARARLRLEELTLEEAVDRAITAIEETHSRVLAITRVVDHMAEVARIEQLALEAGAGTQTDYLRAAADLARSRAALIESRNAEIAAAVELARVTGELGLEWLDNALELNP